MIEYLIIGLSLFLFAMTYNKKALKGNFLLMSFLIIIAIFIVGCRYYIGADWEGYKYLYYTGTAADRISGEVEPMYMFLNNCFHGAGFSHAIFFAFVSFCSLMIIKKAAEIFQISNLAFVFLCYFCLFFCNYQFNIIRHGILASCVWVSYAYLSIDKKRNAYIWALVGCGFHYAGFLYLLSLLCINKKFSKSAVIICLIGSFIFYFLGLGPKIVSSIPILTASQKVSEYMDTDIQDSYGLSVGLIFNLILFSILYFFYHDKYEKDSRYCILLNALLFACISAITLNALGAIVSRLANIFSMSLIFIWPLVFASINNKQLRFIIWLFVIPYLYMYFMKSISKNAITGESSMYPYKINIDQLLMS